MALTAITLFLLLKDIANRIITFKQALYGIVPFIFWILGCVWYISNPGLIPYDFVMGVALGSALLSFISYLTSVIRKLCHPFHIVCITSYASIVFFSLVFILRII